MWRNGLEFQGKLKVIFAPLETALDAIGFAEVESTSTDNWEEMGRNSALQILY